MGERPYTGHGDLEQYSGMKGTKECYWKIEWNSQGRMEQDGSGKSELRNRKCLGNWE